MQYIQSQSFHFISTQTGKHPHTDIHSYTNTHILKIGEIDLLFLKDVYIYKVYISISFWFKNNHNCFFVYNLSFYAVKQKLSHGLSIQK